MKRVDVLVIGSGAAGLRAAAEAAKTGCEVVLLTKGQVGRSGATATVTGDISVDGRTICKVLGLHGDMADSEDAFFEDTVAAGGFLNDQPLAQAMVTGIGAEVKALMAEGLKISGLAHAPGHRFPRGVLVSGMQVLQLLGKRAVEAGVRFREDFYATDILAATEGVGGVAGLDLRSGEVAGIEAKAVILATGGGMMVYPFRTAPEELFGDGYRMALQAGARLIDMEMVQFLPCCLVNPPLWRGIQFPWIIGPQSGMRAWLLNRYGERFMARYDPARMEMATRDIISIACVREVLEGRGGPGGGVFMSWAHLPANLLDFLPQWYGKPLLRANWVWEGFDFRPLVADIKQGHAVEVMPASHFYMGGVEIGAQCETSVPGLYACGEVAGGVHGANRLSGNACSQFLVQGRDAGRAAAAYALRQSWRGVPPAAFAAARHGIEAPHTRGNGIAAHEVTATLQAIANRTMNVVRDGASLATALDEVRALRKEALPQVRSGGGERRYNKRWVDALEARSAALLLEAMIICALERRESRGAHWRQDHPAANAGVPAHGVLSSAGAELVYRRQEVRFPVLAPGLPERNAAR